MKRGTEEYAYDTLPHGICQFNVSGYCIEYLNEKKRTSYWVKKGLSLRWGERKRHEL